MSRRSRRTVVEIPNMWLVWTNRGMFAPGSRVCGWFCESNMRTLKFGLLLAAISLLAISSRAATEKEPSANLLLARQLNQAFIEVAEKVSPAVVVITVIEKPTA